MSTSRNKRALRLARFTATVGLVMVLSGGGPPAVAQPGESRTVVALLPILIHSMESQDFLRAGLADMLLARLGREPQLAIIPIRDEAAATNDLETARGLATAAGAQYVVYGTFTHFGEGASVDLICAPVHGDEFGPRKVFVHAGSLGEVIPTLDALMDRVSRYILEGPAGTPDEEAVGAPKIADAVPEQAPQVPQDPRGASPAGLDALERRVELLERTLGIETEGDEVAVDDDIEEPGIFQVYDNEGSGTPN